MPSVSTLKTFAIFGLLALYIPGLNAQAGTPDPAFGKTSGPSGWGVMDDPEPQNRPGAGELTQSLKEAIRGLAAMDLHGQPDLDNDAGVQWTLDHNGGGTKEGQFLSVVLGGGHADEDMTVVATMGLLKFNHDLDVATAVCVDSGLFPINARIAAAILMEVRAEKLVIWREEQLKERSARKGRNRDGKRGLGGRSS